MRFPRQRNSVLFMKLIPGLIANKFASSNSFQGNSRKIATLVAPWGIRTNWGHTNWHYKLQIGVGLHHPQKCLLTYRHEQ